MGILNFGSEPKSDTVLIWPLSRRTILNQKLIRLLLTVRINTIPVLIYENTGTVQALRILAENYLSKFPRTRYSSHKTITGHTEQGAVDRLQLIGSKGAEAELVNERSAHSLAEGVRLAGQKGILAVVARLTHELAIGVHIAGSILLCPTGGTMVRLTGSLK